MSPVIIDSVVAIILLLSALFALWRGLVRELLTIINLAGASASSWLFAKNLLPITDKFLDVDRSLSAKEQAKVPDIWGVIPPPLMSTVLSYALIFFGVLIVLSIIGYFIGNAVKALGLGPADKILGFVFGAARGFLIVFLLYLPIGYFLSFDKLPAWAQESVSVRMLDRAYVWFDGYSKEKKDEIKKTGDALLEKAKGQVEKSEDGKGAEDGATTP